MVKKKTPLTWFLSLGLNVVVQSKNEQNNAKFPHSEPHSCVHTGIDERLQMIIREGRMLCTLYFLEIRAINFEEGTTCYTVDSQYDFFQLDHRDL